MAKPKPKNNVLLIDSQNFFEKLQESFDGKKYWDIRSRYNYPKLFKSVFKGVRFDEVIFYAGKITPHLKTPRKSSWLIDRQRRTKRYVQNLGYSYEICGRVRGMPEKGRDGKNHLVFREKGVDVKLAVDLVTFAQQGAEHLYLCSSDSDLQPAVRSVKENNKNTEIIYVGFEKQPNKGLNYTCDRTILFRSQEIKDCLK